MDREGSPLRVVLIGPESTGKTRLAGDLAERYGVPWAAEYAREYVEARREPLGFGDVEPIGRGQKAGEDAVLAQARRLGLPLAFLDTDLVSTMVYSRHYYGKCPEWIERDARERRGDLYLLHDVDVDWVADGHQRAAPERREELQALFEATLVGLGAPISPVRGSWSERRRRAIESVDRLLT
ncbi:MAG: ATP-binding protein [Acidobacteria bacterium]|nr:ATP-binding protein [Acidobacteriota bacterium]